MAAGDNHLVLLTNTGVLWTSPIDTHGNLFGQLGFDPKKETSGADTKEDYEILSGLPLFLPPHPKRQMTQAEMLQMAIDVSTSSKPAYSTNQNDRFRVLDNIEDPKPLRKMPFHKLSKEDFQGGVIDQIASGSHHTLAKTADGSVFGFGANIQGQLGLGTSLMTSEMASVCHPVKISIKNDTFNLLSPMKVSGIWAGGASSAFIVERPWSSGNSPLSLTELYMCGHGLWGQLGHGQYKQIQPEPSPVTELSRLTYFDEAVGRLVPIKIVDLSIGQRHCAAVIRTHIDRAYLDDREKKGSILPHFGLTVFVWGANHTYQLGNGRRAMSGKPVQPLPLQNAAALMSSQGGLQLFPGLYRRDSSKTTVYGFQGDPVLPPQKITCGYDTTAAY